MHYFCAVPKVLLTNKLIFRENTQFFSKIYFASGNNAPVVWTQRMTTMQYSIVVLHCVQTYYTILTTQDESCQEARIPEENIATGETSQDIAPFHFFDNFNFHQ